MPMPPTAPSVRRDPVKDHRRQIDAAVSCLKNMHQRDRTTLSQHTDELSRRVMNKNPDVSLSVCVGIVVAAKHFAGTHSSRQKVKKPAEETQPVPSTMQASRKEKIRRRLSFREQSTPAAFCVKTTSDTVASVSVCKRRRQAGNDADWKMDIWRSYGTKEVLPPSPLGCQQSPSLVFAGRGLPPATTPVSLWSPSSNEQVVVMGPDSPDEALEEDIQISCPDGQSSSTAVGSRSI